MLAFSSIEPGETSKPTNERTSGCRICSGRVPSKVPVQGASGWSVGEGVYGGVFGDKRGESILMYGSKAFLERLSSTIFILAIPVDTSST